MLLLFCLSSRFSRNQPNQPTTRRQENFILEQIDSVWNTRHKKVGRLNNQQHTHREKNRAQVLQQKTKKAFLDICCLFIHPKWNCFNRQTAPKGLIFYAWGLKFSFQFFYISTQKFMLIQALNRKSGKHIKQTRILHRIWCLTAGVFQKRKFYQVRFCCVHGLILFIIKKHCAITL